jgi:hypothetical protein
MIKVYLSLLILVQSSLGFAQFKQSGMRKATHQEVKEIVPEEIKNKTKEFSSKVGPLIQNEVSQKILLNKYSNAENPDDIIVAKKNIKDYFQKKVNEGYTKNDLIGLSNTLNIDMYDNLHNKRNGIESEIKKNIQEKNLELENKMLAHTKKWETIDPSSITENQKIEYTKDTAALRLEEDKIGIEVQSLLGSSKSLEKIELEAKNFQEVLKQVVTEVDYSSINSSKPNDISPQVFKMDVYVPKGFTLENYKRQKSNLNIGNISFLTNPNDITPLCYQNTTSVNDTNLFLKDGTDILNKLTEKGLNNTQGSIYFSWGYNRAWHSDADATFTTSEGTFTIHDAHGDDRQTKFDPKVYFNPATMSIPQYNLKVGYMFNDKWGIEAGTDHMKWVFDQSRKYDISGNFDAQVVVPNPDSQYGWDAVKPVDFSEVKESGDVSWLAFEHSDGYNYAHISGVYNQNIIKTKNKVFALDARFGAGAGLMIPKTKVMMHRDQAWNWEGLDNKFHVAGGGIHGDVRLKMTFFDRVFIQGVARGNAIKVKNALVYTDSDPGARLEQDPIYSGQLSVEIGANFPINAKKNKKKNKPH